MDPSWISLRIDQKYHIYFNDNSCPPKLAITPAAKKDPDGGTRYITNSPLSDIKTGMTAKLFTLKGVIHGYKPEGTIEVRYYKKPFHLKDIIIERPIGET